MSSYEITAFCSLVHMLGELTAFIFGMKENKEKGCWFPQNVGTYLPYFGPYIQFWGLQGNQNVEAPTSNKFIFYFFNYLLLVNILPNFS